MSKLLDNLNYKNYGFNNVSLWTIFLRDTYINDISIENVDNEQNDIRKRFSKLHKGRKS